MTGRYPEPRDTVKVEAALRAVEGEVLELALDVGLYVEQLEPEHLGVGDERIGPAVANVDRLVAECVGLRSLLGDGPGPRAQGCRALAKPCMRW